MLCRRHDYEGFLSAIFFPDRIRHAQWALRAFNVELAQIRDQVTTDDTLGKIRFQWWRDAVDEIFGGAGGGASTGHVIHGHPVAVALRYLVADDGLPLSKMFFKRMITARVCALLVFVGCRC